MPILVIIAVAFISGTSVYLFTKDDPQVAKFEVPSAQEYIDDPSLAACEEAKVLMEEFKPRGVRCLPSKFGEIEGPVEPPTPPPTTPTTLSENHPHTYISNVVPVEDIPYGARHPGSLEVHIYHIPKPVTNAVEVEGYEVQSAPFVSHRLDPVWVNHTVLELPDERNEYVLVTRGSVVVDTYQDAPSYWWRIRTISSGTHSEWSDEEVYRVHTP